MLAQAYISYYKKHGISPIEKKIENMRRFFSQRYFLYRSLGIPPSLKGLNVIEFGPGNGVNAVYTNSLQPNKYVLIDGNPVGIKNLRENLETHYSDLHSIEIHECLFEDFNHQPNFDLVICENALHGQKNKIIELLSNNVKNNGIMFVTCNDSASILSEILRSLVGIIISRNIESFNDKTEFLVKCFSKHLDSLKFVGRNYIDWVHDNILNDINLDFPVITTCDVIDSLTDNFIVHGSSPKFLSDLRWYKSVVDRADLIKTNKIAKESYLMNVVNMIDCRLDHPPHSIDLGLKLLLLSEKIKTFAGQYAKSNACEIKEVIQETLLEMSLILNRISPATSAALDAFHAMFKNQQFASIMNDDRVISWWGRGTQYLSLVRCD